MTTIEIACRCGDVRIEVAGEPIVQMHCHCDDCQAVHGGAYVPESVYRADAVKVVAGTPRTWKLKTSPRLTCPTCGTRLFIEVLRLGLRGINGYLLPPGQFRAAFHMNCRFAIAPVRDGLPHYASRPAQFGGTGETVDW